LHALQRHCDLDLASVYRRRLVHGNAGDKILQHRLVRRQRRGKHQIGGLAEIGMRAGLDAPLFGVIDGAGLEGIIGRFAGAVAVQPLGRQAVPALVPAPAPPAPAPAWHQR